MILEARINTKTYPSRTPGENFTALADLEFVVPEGELTCIVGPSGCGKTTLLNIISGLDRDVDGEVSINGKGPEDTLIGYVFQTPRLMPWLSVVDNVRLVMDSAGVDNGLAEHLLEEMQLEDVMDAFPNRLSGGMRRRVALARAFVVKPKLLLMDEPFVSLDQPAAMRLRELLLHLWDESPTTVLFVTHDLNEALFLADRILFMSASPGRIVFDFTVPLSRPREALPESEIENLRRRLLKEYPDLLAGLIGAADGGPGGDHASGPADGGGEEAAERHPSDPSTSWPEA